MRATGQPRIAVVGAGIGGLTLAGALAAVGVGCTVFEQARRLGEVGAGVQIAPNAVRLLHRLGLAEELRKHAVAPAAIEISRWDDGRPLSRTTLGARCERMYGAPYYTVHRAHLHRALVDLVDRVHQVEPGCGAGAGLWLGRRVVRVADLGDRVVLFFDDGGTHTADVVVGADGVHSAVREAAFPDTPVFSGQRIYRALVPVERVPARLGDPPTVRVWVGPGGHCVCYPVSGGRLLSVAATTQGGDPLAESWSASGDPEQLVDAFRGWHDTVCRLLRAAGTVRCWALHDREPLRRWGTGRTTLLGDAAHPMLPFMAQGANQAIEDAAALAACLAGVPDTADLGARLRRYEAARLPRTALVQRGSRGNGRAVHLADGEDQRRRDAAISGEDGLGRMAWLYGYDAERAVGR